MLSIVGARSILIDERRERTGDLLLRGDRVIEPAPDDQPVPDEILDASGCVITPGLVNAHHHFLQSAFRTMPGTRGVSMAKWLTTMAAAYHDIGLDADLCAISARIAVAEGVLCGVTTVADHQLNWPADADSVDLARAIADASREIGARLIFVRGSARHDPQLVADSAEAILDSLLPNAHDGVSPDGMLQLAVGPAGVHSDNEATFRLLGEVASRRGLRRRTQANEQVDVAAAMERYGRRPLDLLDEWGWLAPDVTIAHLCDVTPVEIERLAAAGASATHAPACDVPMGWGVSPVALMRDAGISIGLGTSGGGSNDAGHLLADARLAMQISGLVGPQLTAREVLHMATEGGAAGLGRDELGNLRAGAAADLCIWDVSGVADAGVADPIAGLLWASPGRRPRHVVVAGKTVVRDYRLVNANESELTRQLARRTSR